MTEGCTIGQQLVEENRRITWLAQAPLITMLDLDYARPPKPITWAQQRVLLPHLSDHSAQMALWMQALPQESPCSHANEQSCGP